jgi:hypothetical protein
MLQRVKHPGEHVEDHPRGATFHVLFVDPFVVGAGRPMSYTQKLWITTLRT